MAKKKKSEPFSPSENHSYNVNVACHLGCPKKAVILKEMYRTSKWAIREDIGDFDGFHWFRLKREKLVSHYPEFGSASTIYRWINSLEDQAFLMWRDDLNQHGYDRTRWYCVNIDLYDRVASGGDSHIANCQPGDFQFSEWELAFLKMAYSISQNENSNSQDATTILTLNNSLDKSLFDSSISVGNYSDQVKKQSRRKRKLPLKEKDLVAFKGQISEVLEHFKQVTGFACEYHFDGQGSGHVQKVLTLLKRNFSVEELKAIVDMKFLQWSGTDTEQYLATDTLFGSKNAEKYREHVIRMKTDEKFRKSVVASYMKRTGQAGGSGKSFGSFQATSQTIELKERLRTRRTT